MEGALLRPLHKSGRLREGRLTERSIRSIIIRRARDAGVQGRISGNNQRVAARRAWRMRAPLWPRCSPPGAGAPPSCRCATRRKTPAAGRRGEASLRALTNKAASARRPHSGSRYFFHTGLALFLADLHHLTSESGYLRENPASKRRFTRWPPPCSPHRP